MTWGEPTATGFEYTPSSLDTAVQIVEYVNVGRSLDNLVNDAYETRDPIYNAIARQRGITLKPLPPDQDHLNMRRLIDLLRAPGLLRLNRKERLALADSLERRL